MAELKTRETDADVDAFLDTVEPETKRAEAREIVAMLQEATGEPPRMWGKSIVGFGHYHYVYASGREGDWMRIGFSPRKARHVLYLIDGYDEREALLDRLGKHKLGKSCLYINKLDDIDRAVLRELVDASLERMAERYPEGA